MASEIKVDTVSEKTSGSGVTIDGLLIKDGGISGDVSLIGTTPTFTIGDAGAEDAALVFDGNAQDFYIALDDSADDLIIGLGSAVGTTPMLSFTEAKAASFAGAVTMATTLGVTGAVTSAALTASGILKTDDATDATSTTDGSLQTDGGLSVAKDTIIGNDLKLLSDSAVLVFGAGSDATLTHTNDVGLTLNSTNKLMFNDASQFIQGASATVLDIAATDEIELTATLTEVVGRLEVTGGVIFNEASADVDFRVESNGNANMLHVDGGNDGVGIGTTGGAHTLTVNDTTDFVSGSSNVANTAPLNVRSAASSGNIGAISIGGNDNVALFNPSSNKLGLQAYDYIGFFVSNTNDDKVGTKTERARLNADGIFALGSAALSAGVTSDSTIGASMHPEGRVNICYSGTGGHALMTFRNGNNEIGSISNSGTSAIAYNTSSDYRLKEAIDYTWDATTRLKQLKPARFNFKADEDNTLVDGFLAHEVSSVVPEAISGTKDATETKQKVVLKSNGNLIVDNIEEEDWTKGKTDGVYANDTTWEASKVFPIYQGIDQSKLVPLLVKTVLELEARIATLEG